MAEITLDADGVNRFVADAILQSAIGEAINKSIADALQDWKMKQAVDAAVKNAIAHVIHDLLRGEHGDPLRAAVRERITSDIVGDLAGKALDAWLASRE